MVKIKVLSSLKQVLSIDTIELMIDDRNTTLMRLLKILKNKYPQFSFILEGDQLKPGYLLLVNDIDHRLLGADYVIKNDDKITILPVSHGG